MAVSISMRKHLGLIVRVWLLLVWSVAICEAATLQRDYYSSQREQPAVDSLYNADPSFWSPPNSPVVPYGGDAFMVSFRHQQPEQPPLAVPRVDLQDMALSLRFTCEMNRRLLHGTAQPLKTLPSAIPARALSSHHQPALEQRGGQTTFLPVGTPVNVHPSKQWQPPIRTVATTKAPELTLFHAKSARPTKKHKRRPRGVARWGPDIHHFLQHVTTALGIEDSPIVLALAMIYLDRACSVETPRNYESSLQPCPCATPRTVHRLAVVALLLAHKTVNGGTTEQHWEKLQNLGIPLEQLIQMESWMMGALGDHGLFVPEEDLYGWLKAWHETFSKNKQQSSARVVQ